MSEQSPPSPEPGEVPADDDLLGAGEPRGTDSAAPRSDDDQSGQSPGPTRGHGDREDDVPAPRDPQAGM